MAFISNTPQLGIVNLTDVDTLAPGFANTVAGTGSGRWPELGATVTGYDPSLGGGEFVYLKGVASLAVGDTVSYNGATGATTRWAGTANTGSPLAIAISVPSATQYGWFQIGGNAIATVSGTVVAGDAAFFASTATLKTAAVAGKQVLNCVAAVAPSATIGSITLTSTQAVYTIQRPFCQGQIT